MGGIHSLALSASKRRKNLFRNIKYEITLEVLKINHQQAYEKEYWRLSGYKRIIREDQANEISKETARRVLRKTDLMMPYLFNKIQRSKCEGL